MRTERVKVNGTFHYGTTLLRLKGAPPLKATPTAVMPLLCSTKRQIQRDPVQAKQYEDKIQKLISAGYVIKLSDSEVQATGESWFIPHHLVNHNKPRLVWNCSFVYNGLSLNEQLCAGPTLGPFLIGVFLRVRQNAVAISGISEQRSTRFVTCQMTSCCLDSFGETSKRLNNLRSTSGLFWDHQQPLLCNICTAETRQRPRRRQ